MPAITLSLPAALGLLAFFLLLGAVMVFFLLRSTGRVAEPTPTVTPSPSPTVTPSPTPVTPTPTNTPLPTPTPLTYTVAAGDTCSTIAFRFGVSIQSIVLMNGLPAACDTLFVGQQLKIPHPTPTNTPLPTATLSGPEATIAACEKVNYTVASGDTLSTIAANYNVPITAIKSYNGLVTDNVFEGQELIIPLCERLAPAGPTPTPTPPPPYPAPNLLLPADGAAFTLDQAVALQWAAVATLRENEAYRVTLVDVTTGEDRRLVAYVTDTKFVVPDSMRPTDAQPHVFRWWVEPVRQTDTDEEGNPIWQSAGAVSAQRVFTWWGAGSGTSTP